MTPARRKMLNISALVVIVGALIGGAVAAANVIMHARDGMGQIQSNTVGVQKNRRDIDAHAEQNQQARDAVADWRREMESTATATSTNVEWIRKRMEREHP